MRPTREFTPIDACATPEELCRDGVFSRDEAGRRRQQQPTQGEHMITVTDTDRRHAERWLYRGEDGRIECDIPFGAALTNSELLALVERGADLLGLMIGFVSIDRLPTAPATVAESVVDADVNVVDDDRTAEHLVVWNETMRAFDEAPPLLRMSEVREALEAAMDDTDIEVRIIAAGHKSVTVSDATGRETDIPANRVNYVYCTAADVRAVVAGERDDMLIAGVLANNGRLTIFASANQ